MLKLYSNKNLLEFLKNELDVSSSLIIEKSSDLKFDKQRALILPDDKYGLFFNNKNNVVFLTTVKQEPLDLNKDYSKLPKIINFKENKFYLALSLFTYKTPYEILNFIISGTLTGEDYRKECEKARNLIKYISLNIKINSISHFDAITEEIKFYLMKIHQAILIDKNF